MNTKFKSALAIVAGALAAAISPPAVEKPAAWSAENLVVADGPLAGQKWSADLTPQLPEILDALEWGQPHNTVGFRKSAQVGATGIGIAWIAWIIDVAPAKGMTIFPTTTSVQEYNREKLQPTIDETPSLKKKVRSQTSRSSQGSTALSKRYPGGSLVLTGANSTADLRSKTVKFQHRDEIDDWPWDLDGQGDPEEMADARLIAFHATGDYMVFKSSTPTIKGESRIDDVYDAGDQRNWNVKCPHCGGEQKLEFGGKDSKHGLKFNTEPPYDAHYVCRHSGCIIEHHEKPAMIRGGRWVAEKPNEGRYPSFHLDAISSLLTTWDKVAEAFLRAKDKPTKLKGFVNLWLGQSWEERGEAPDWKKLMLRREAFDRRRIPAGGLFHTLAVDVQEKGLFYEVVSWGREGRSWSIDADFIPGDDTADTSDRCWKALTETAERLYPDAYGNRWPVDMIGVDSGFNTKAVYAWCRGRPNAMALKGQPGWYHPPIGTPSDVAVDFKGKKRKGKMQVWPVGTWPLKSELYAELRKEGKRDGEEIDPPGYTYFSSFHDEGFFKQLTAEHLKPRQVRGRMIKEWVASGANHFHDCRIYGKALAERLGLSVMTDEDWQQLQDERTRVVPGTQGDLLDASMKKTPAKTRPRGRRNRSKGVR